MPDGLHIRQATSADLDRLQAFAVQTWRDAFAHTYSDPADPADHIAQELSIERFTVALNQDAILLALDADNTLIGYLQIGPAAFDDLATDPGDQDLRRLYVDSTLLGHGIGHVLMDAALRLPQVRQAGRVYLDVWEKNSGAQKLYRNYGFKVIAERRYVSPSGTPGDVDYQMCRDQRSQQR